MAQPTTASSSVSGSPAGGAMDGDRFGSANGTAWQGEADPSGTWWWQVTFPAPRRVGAILQMNGQAGDVFTAGPRDYVWQFSRDGETWVDLKDTRTVNEQRAFRLHRLQQVVEARWFRLRIDAAMTPATGPILREVEFYPETDSPVAFPDWVLSVNITDRPWDCPHCRDPQSPKLPIYTHIHCGAAPGTKTKCGVYGTCEFERGPHQLQIVRADPVFAGLPASGVFTCRESHCGQVEYLPGGWTLLASHGPDGKTKNQLMRVDEYPIYAAQFHIDMGGEHAKILAKNFLELARQWQRRTSAERVPSAQKAD